MRFIVLLLGFLTIGLTAHAQNGVPDMPAPIANLSAEGAQIRYLGREHGFDAWLTVKNGQEQYFYVPLNGTGFVMGLLFDNNGRVVTVDQVQRLRDKGDTLLDSLASVDDITASAPKEENRFSFQTPAERLFHDMENSNWITLGFQNAPAVYAIIDPQCPHCHTMINAFQSEGYFDRGALQVRVVPVGFSAKSKAQAAFLMATPDPQARFFRHLAGDEDALPVREDINEQGVERNLALMQAWKFDVTPMLVYRSKDGSVKIVRGKPKDIPAMLADLAPAG